MTPQAPCTAICMMKAPRASTIGCDAADLLRQVAKDEAAGNRAEIGDDDNPADRARIEIMLLLQEGRIEVLRAVAEQIEAHHQHDHVDDQTPVGGNRLPSR